MEEDNIDELFKAWRNAEEVASKAEDKYRNALARLPKVDRVVRFCTENQLPTYQVFDCIGNDSRDEYYDLGDGITVSPVYAYGYTDITGLSDEDFKTVQMILERDERY